MEEHITKSYNKSDSIRFFKLETAIENIPIVSILDTNCDPDLVDVPIPGNNDSIGSIKLILKTLGKSILNGGVS